MIQDLKTQKIIAWRESLKLLPDNQFFDLMHIYLGKIKTPYNKTDLIEQISAFLRKDENKKTIIKLLTKTDIKILTAINFINECTFEKLEEFFSSDETFSQKMIFEKLENLNQRLLIFAYEDKISLKKIININPLLFDELEKFLTLQNLISFVPKNQNEKNVKTQNLLCADYLAAFISYVQNHKDLCKANGEFKKKSLGDIQEIFGSDEIKKLEKIFNAFVNLNLILEKDDDFVLDWQRLNLFCELSKKNQLIYLCAASCGNFSKSTIQKNAQVLLDIFESMGNFAYEKKSILQISYLIKEKIFDTENISGSRFAKILSRASGENSSENFFASSAVVCAMIDASYDFGLVSLQDKKFYSLSENFLKIFCESENQNLKSEELKVLSLDSAFSISVMPGLSLKQYLEILKFLNLVHYDTVSTYELSKKSVMNAFNSKMSAQEILENLKKYSFYEIPQSIKVSIQEWSSIFNSVNIYKGFVLKVSSENSALIEKNPQIKNHIFEILAPGIFLLDCENDEEAKSLFLKSGLDFEKNIESSSQKIYLESFKNLIPNVEKFEFDENADFENLLKENETQGKAILEDLKTQLENIKMTSEQKEVLAERIKMRTVLSKEQLRAESVRFEVREVYGMDFQAKVLLIESAIQNNSLVELEIDANKKMIIALPFNFNRKTGLLSVKTFPKNELQELPLASILRIKKIGMLNRWLHFDVVQ